VSGTPPQQVPQRDPGRRAFLIVRLGALGDIVHALPLAAALRATWPDARIDWLVDVKHRAILDHVGGLSAIVPVDTRRMAGETGVVPVVRRLRAARYDVAIDAQGLLKSAVLAYLAGAARVVGLARDHLRERLASWAYDDTAQPAGPHVVDHALALAQAAGAAAGPPRFALQAPASDVVAHVRDQLGLEPTAGATQPFALINPGAAWPNKRWPPDRLGAVARHIRERHRMDSVVLWGPGEEDAARRVVDASGGVARLAPTTGLPEVIALLRRASLMVSGDTGPVHIAAALGVPVVALFGPTTPGRNGPWDPDDTCVSRYAECDCHYERRCRRDEAHWCLGTIAVDEVTRAIDDRLARARARERH